VAYTVVTAPATEPLTLAEAKDHLGVVHASDDALITSMVSAARELVEVQTGRTVAVTTFDLFLDRFPPGDEAIRLPKPPAQSVTSLKYIDLDGVEQTVPPSVYVFDGDSTPGRVYLDHGKSWPDAREQRHAVTVRFVAGYSAVPERVKHLVRLLVGAMYEQREAQLDFQTHANAAVKALVSSLEVPRLA